MNTSKLASKKSWKGLIIPKQNETIKVIADIFLFSWWWWWWKLNITKKKMWSSRFSPSKSLKEMSDIVGTWWMTLESILFHFIHSIRCFDRVSFTLLSKETFFSCHEMIFECNYRVEKWETFFFMWQVSNENSRGSCVLWIKFKTMNEILLELQVRKRIDLENGSSSNVRK